MPPIKTKKSIYPYIVASLLAVAYVPPYEAEGDISIPAFAIKIFPILYLISYVNSYLESTDKLNSTNKGKERDKLAIQRRHLAFGVDCGLACSAVGDVILLLRETSEAVFLAGTIAFACGQICYIYAMTFSYTRKGFGLFLYASTSLLSFVILKDAALVPRVVLSLYGFLLVTSLWRAMDRVHQKDGRTDAQKKLLVLGFTSFFVSDVMIGYSTFLNRSHPILAMQFILLTYYAAQGLIAVAVT